MGDYVLRVHAVGGHGCQREVKDGGTVGDCGSTHCPDCSFRRFVAELKKSNDVKVATITHWPAELPHYNGQDQVLDNVLTGRRKGSF